MKFSIKNIFKKSSKNRVEKKQTKLKIEDYKANEMVKDTVGVMKKHLLKDGDRTFLVDALENILKIHSDDNYFYKGTCSGIFCADDGNRDKNMRYKYNGDVFEAVWRLGALISGAKVRIDGQNVRFNEEAFMDEAYHTLVGEYNSLVCGID